jgi:hypothetical protein
MLSINEFTGKKNWFSEGLKKQSIRFPCLQITFSSVLKIGSLSL